MWEGIRKETIRLQKELEEGVSRYLLFQNMLECSSCGEKCKIMHNMRYTYAKEGQGQILFKGMPKDRLGTEEGKWNSEMQGEIGSLFKTNKLFRMWDNISANVSFNDFLFKRMCRYGTRKENERGRKFKLQRRFKYYLYEAFRRTKTINFRERQQFLYCMWDYKKSSSSPYKREEDSRRTNKFDNIMQVMSYDTPRLKEDTISTIKEISGEPYDVYDIQVEGTSNFFANSILVHNCLIVDDPFRSRADAESPTIRQKVFEWFGSTFRTRRQKDASILVIATRWHEADLSGKLIELAEKDPKADQWEVINLPALSEEDIEPYDLRTEQGQALWPSEFPLDDLLSTKASLTVYEWLSLYQQRPSAAQGNLVKREQFKYCELAGYLL
jgi:hypothetical protein